MSKKETRQSQLNKGDTSQVEPKTKPENATFLYLTSLLSIPSFHALVFHALPSRDFL